jgi:hypothetical protein
MERKRRISSPLSTFCYGSKTAMREQFRPGVVPWRQLNCEALSGNIRCACALSLAVHTIAVYAWSAYSAPWLVYSWFGWATTVLRVTPQATPLDWYLQHLAMVSFVPVVAGGYIGSRYVTPKTATGAWLLPTLVLGYELLRFQPIHSVLLGSSMSAFQYYFEIIQQMPIGKTNLFVLTRLLGQLRVTAPFYSGIAYSLGACACEARLFEKLFGSGKLAA